MKANIGAKKPAHEKKNSARHQEWVERKQARNKEQREEQREAGDLITHAQQREAFLHAMCKLLPPK